MVYFLAGKGGHGVRQGKLKIDQQSGNLTSVYLEVVGRLLVDGHGFARMALVLFKVVTVGLVGEESSVDWSIVIIT